MANPENVPELAHPGTLLLEWLVQSPTPPDTELSLAEFQTRTSQVCLAKLRPGFADKAGMVTVMGTMAIWFAGRLRVLVGVAKEAFSHVVIQSNFTPTVRLRWPVTELATTL